MIEPSDIDAAGLLREAEARFTLETDSIHGPDHWRAVLANGMALASSLQSDRSLVAVFSLLHDCCRENEWHDPLHGPRAAGVARELNGRFFDFSETRLSRLTEAIRCTTTRKQQDLDISCCWAADRIELRRVGIEPARSGFLRQDVAGQRTNPGVAQAEAGEERCAIMGVRSCRFRESAGDPPQAWRGEDRRHAHEV